MVGRAVPAINGLQQRLPRAASKMHVQARLTPPEHLPLGDCVSVDIEWRGGLEAEYNGEADSAGDTEVVEGRAQYW